MANVEAQISDLKTKIAAAQARQVRAQVEREQAAKALAQAREALEAEYGVRTTEQAREVLAGLQEALDTALVQAQEMLA